jgi:hypothetical protein
MHEQAGEMSHRGAHALADAERLLARAEQDPAAARPAAVAALRALLLEWTLTPRGERVTELVAQAAETDETLAELRHDAMVLDGEVSESPGDAFERALTIVNAARGRLANI